MKFLLSTIQTCVLVILLRPGSASARPLPAGFSTIEVSSGGNTVTVFTYKPPHYTNGPLLVVCHGMLRDAEVYCSNAVPLAKKYHMLVVAPWFDTNHFSREDYNLGGVIKHGVVQPREKWTYQFILQTVAEVRKREGKSDLAYYVIGHSAGGQFAMRYAAMMPAGAQRIVAMNPGSDLFPRRDWEFGYGFGGLSAELSDDDALQRYLAAPLTIYLGLADTDPHHPELDTSAAAEREGKFRLERGRACFAYAQRLAAENGWKFNWRKVEVPGIAHDRKAMLAAREAAIALFSTNP